MVRRATITSKDITLSKADMENLLPGYIAKQETDAGNIIDESDVKVFYTVPIRFGESMIYKVLWVKQS